MTYLMLLLCQVFFSHRLELYLLCQAVMFGGLSFRLAQRTLQVNAKTTERVIEELKELDIDGDGTITVEEFVDNGKGQKEEFEELDANNDGHLDRDELRQKIRKDIENEQNAKDRDETEQEEEHISAAVCSIYWLADVKAIIYAMSSW